MGGFDKWHAYFQSVNDHLTRRLASPDFEETSATDLLCQMMDDKHSSDSHLEFSLKDLKESLMDIGEDYDISITTAKQGDREKTSGLDLGVIFHDLRYGLQPDVRAIIFQVKRLYPISGANYAVNSRYEAFNRSQLGKIRTAISNTDDRWAFYLLLNPALKSFINPQDVQSAELKIKNDINYHCHQVSSDTFDGFPGTRVSAICSVEDAARNQSLRLRDFYDLEHTDWSFPTFADFMTQFVQKEVGSSHPRGVSSASGKKLDGSSGVSHTINIVVREREFD